MKYLTTKEVAQKWGISRRAISYHLQKGRIPGVIQKEQIWLIPDSALRPADKRRKNQALPQTAPEEESSLLDDLRQTMAESGEALPLEEPEGILKSVQEPARSIYEAELCYLRGDLQGVLRCFHKAQGRDAVRLQICPIAVTSAIILGDDAAYRQVDAYLSTYERANTCLEIRRLTEISRAIVALAIPALDLVPLWIQRGELSDLLELARPVALYLQATYLRTVGQLQTAWTIAKTVLSLSGTEEGIRMNDLHLRLSCAVSCYALGHREEARDYLLFAMRQALPHGFIMPFVEGMISLGGLVEQQLKAEFPEHYPAVMALFEMMCKNWAHFHNQFSHEKICLILTLREYHIATLAARHIPYPEIAEQYGISVGRLKNIMLEIREKLGLHGKEELDKFVLEIQLETQKA